MRLIQNTLCDHVNQNPTNFVHHNPCLWIKNFALQDNGLLQITKFDDILEFQSFFEKNDFGCK